MTRRCLSAAIYMCICNIGKFDVVLRTFMDGFGFLEQYHEEGLQRLNHIIILMLTSSASFYDLEKLKQYDKVKKHLPKALTEADVRDIMKTYFKQHTN